MKNYRLVHLRCEQYQLSTAGKRLKISIVRTRKKKKDLSKNILTKICTHKGEQIESDTAHITWHALWHLPVYHRHACADNAHTGMYTKKQRQ